MKSKLITVSLSLTLILILVFLGIWFFNKDKKSDKKEALTVLSTSSENANMTPPTTPSPIEYNFDSKTDLKQELNSINPQILDSDFDNLKKIGNQL